MGRQAVEAHDTVSIAAGSDQLARRVLAMVDSPVAWLGKRVRIHRLETDGDREWAELMGRLAVTAGLQMDFDGQGAVILQWERIGDLGMAFDTGVIPPCGTSNEAPF